jgi:hypothetical protein
MSVNAISMRRAILGEGSFAESLLGRILILVLYTSLVGIVLTLLFVVNRQWAPVFLKYVILVATGIAAGFGARRLLVGRPFLMKLGAGIFALAMALGVMNVLTLGYLGLNLLRAYPSNPEWDGALQLVVASIAAWAALRAWAVIIREVVVEPRYSSAPAALPAPRPAPRSTPQRSSRRISHSVRRPSRSRARTASSSLGASFSAWTNRVATQLGALLPAPAGGTATRRRKLAKKSAKGKSRRQRFRRREPAVYLSGNEEHRCPYCLEEVRPNDPRGVKICKVCKTWHHGDCWSVTGVCQVPHQYVN